MVSRILRLIAPIVVAVVLATPAQADWLSSFIHTVVRDTKRRNCWPKPFTCPDRQAVGAPFVKMIHNGWRRQNMLGDHHFVPGTTDLTEAGELKVRWILVEAPSQHRMIYVHRAETAEATAARIASVHQFASKVIVEGELPPILETGISAQGCPAARVEAITRKFQESIPEPVLPASQGTTQ